MSNKSDFSVCITNKNDELYLITIQEGSGDNLLPEDEKEGYVDYMNLASYRLENDAFVEEDGGMEMFEKLYLDFSQEELINMAIANVGLSEKAENGQILILPEKIDTAYVEDHLNDSILLTEIKDAVRQNKIQENISNREQ